MSEPSSDAKLQLGELIATVKAFTGQMSDLKGEVGQVRIELKLMEKRIDERTAAKPIPWLSIAGFTITFLGFIGVLLAAFVLYHVDPIKKDVDDLGRKIDRETTAVETRLTAAIDAQRRDVQSFKDATNRDLQWNYANQNLRHDFTTKNVERIWAKVFAGEPPSYQPPSRPTQ